MLVENIIPLPQFFVEIILKIKKILRCTCSTCKKNKSPIVSDHTIQAEGLEDYFKLIGKAAKSVGKIILDNPGRAIEIAANIGTAAASKNPKLIAATAPDNTSIVRQRKGLHMGKNSLIKFIIKTIMPKKCIQSIVEMI